MSRGHRPTATTVIAFVALFAALGGGTAIAAKKLTGKDIKDGSIGLKDLVRRRPRAAWKATAARTGATGARGAAGPQGPAGPPGAAGAPGAPGVNRLQYAVGDDIALCATGGADPACTVGFSEAICPAGMVATGGGHECGRCATGAMRRSRTTRRNLDGTGWIVAMVNNAAVAADFYAVAHCVPGTIGGAPAASAGASVEELRDSLVAQARAASR